MEVLGFFFKVQLGFRVSEFGGLGFRVAEFGGLGFSVAGRTGLCAQAEFGGLAV